ncbi:ribonuclease HI family protein [Furfurilactobacillus rossiae]|uniref:ribonuclease HI family protein n=1 Tax=Furfurilactobacillus rossiae TaxID=231049 RepID=UPI00384C5C3A
MMIKLYTDAASVATHPKIAQIPSGAGILLVQNGHQYPFKQIVTAVDNHAAEFQAAIIGFEKAQKLSESEETVMFFTDSRLVADAVGKGVMKHYPDLTQKLLALQDSFQLVITQWIPDRQNMGAHRLALQALHQAH